MTNEANNTVVDYRRTLANMLDDLKRVRDHAAELELTDTAEHANQTHERIENSFFKIAVVGEFKRGKSTLINALLGSRILPDSVLPCSATLNRVTYGPTPSVHIFYKEKEGESKPVEEIRVEELVDFVTKLTPESEVKAADIKEAVVFYPTPYCRDKADIIDTPGLNDDENMTSVTLSVIPKTDAAIMLVMAQAPFAGTEGDFLNKKMLASDIGRVLFVVNRIDEIEPEDRERLYRHIEQRIGKSVRQRAAELYGEGTEDYVMFVKRTGNPRVFGVSAKQALKAKVSGDDKLLRESGFFEFEHALEHFLTYEKGNITIQVLADCIVGTTYKILHKLSLQESALKMKTQDFESVSQAAMATLEELSQKYDSEMKTIDQAAVRTFNYTYSTLDRLEGEIKKAAEGVIDSAKIGPSDIDKANLPRTQEELSQKISNGIHDAMRSLSEKTQVEIERELRNELNRLQDFSRELCNAMDKIEFEFRHVAVDESALGNDATTMAAGGVLGTLAPLPVGGFLTGWREAGGKGAAVGGAAGMGAAFATWVGGVVLVGVLGIPITLPIALPIILAGGIMSAFGGKWAARTIFSAERVDRFKDSYKEAVLKKIELDIGEKKFEFVRQLKQQVDTAFEALKKHVHVELGSQIAQTRQTIEDLRGKQARTQTEIELELKHLVEVRLDVEKIQSRALAKSKELREITSV